MASNLGVEADKPVMPYSKGSYNTKSWATADLHFHITGTHTVLLFLDIVEPNSVSDVKCPLLRSFPFKHREWTQSQQSYSFYRVTKDSYTKYKGIRRKFPRLNAHARYIDEIWCLDLEIQKDNREFQKDKIFKRSQVLSYRSFEHLRFHKVIKSNFHSIHVELKNAAGHLVTFFPIGQVQLTLLFQKNLDYFLNYHYKERSAKMQMNSLSHSMLDFFGKVPILDPILWSNEQQIVDRKSLKNITISFQQIP